MENREEHNAKLLGLVAFSRITAYARLARDVSQTTNFADQLALARLGVSFVKAIDDLEEFASTIWKPAPVRVTGGNAW